MLEMAQRKYDECTGPLARAPAETVKNVDVRQRTSAEGVWAAGDCCESFHLVSHRKVHVALGTVANKQGRVVGINVGGGYATFPGIVGTAVTKLCDTEIARTGLNEREATQAGFGYSWLVTKNGTNITIPDLATAESSITITGCTGNASATGTVAVDIKHTYRGDLVISLIAPDGTSYKLKGSSSTDEPGGAERLCTG